MAVAEIAFYVLKIGFAAAECQFVSRRGPSPAGLLLEQAQPVIGNDAAELDLQIAAGCVHDCLLWDRQELYCWIVEISFRSVMTRSFTSIFENSSAPS